MRIIEKALAEFDVADLQKALRGLKAHREGPGKGRSTDLAAALGTNPRSGPLHEHIAFWIDFADKAEQAGQQSDDDLDPEQVIREQEERERQALGEGE